MKHKVDSAVIMAAGRAVRMLPLAKTVHKSMLTVRGEVLIERQIRQLREAGVPEVVVVCGHLKEQLSYLEKEFGAVIVENKEYLTMNNCGSLLAAEPWLGNSFICSCDNYFAINPFESCVSDAYYSVLYSEGRTEEWCVETDEEGYISRVEVGGSDRFYMMGHVFWTECFSKRFMELVKTNYGTHTVREQVWEALYSQHLDELKLKTRIYGQNDIFEIDCPEDLKRIEGIDMNGHE